MTFETIEIEPLDTEGLKNSPYKKAFDEAFEPAPVNQDLQDYYEAPGLAAERQFTLDQQRITDVEPVDASNVFDTPQKNNASFELELNNVLGKMMERGPSGQLSNISKFVQKHFSDVLEGTKANDLLETISSIDGFTKSNVENLLNITEQDKFLKKTWFTDRIKDGWENSALESRSYKESTTRVWFTDQLDFMREQGYITEEVHKEMSMPDGLNDIDTTFFGLSGSSPWERFYDKQALNEDKFMSESVNNDTLNDNEKAYFQAIKDNNLMGMYNLDQYSKDHIRTKIQEYEQKNPDFFSGETLGNMAYVLTEPEQIATLAIAPEAKMLQWSAKGIFVTAGTVAAKEAGINAVAEIPNQYRIYRARNELGLNYSFSDALLGMTIAGVGAGVIRGTGSSVIDTFKLHDLSGIAKSFGSTVPEVEEIIHLTQAKNDLREVFKSKLDLMFEKGLNGDMGRVELIQKLEAIGDKDALAFKKASEQLEDQTAALKYKYHPEAEEVEVLDIDRFVKFLENETSYGASGASDIGHDSPALKRKLKELEEIQNPKLREILQDIIKNKKANDIIDLDPAKFNDYPEIQKFYNERMKHDSAPTVTKSIERESNPSVGKERVKQRTEDLSFNKKAATKEKVKITAKIKELNQKAIDNPAEAVKFKAEAVQLQKVLDTADGVINDININAKASADALDSYVVPEAFSKYKVDMNRPLNAKETAELEKIAEINIKQSQREFIEMESDVLISNWNYFNQMNNTEKKAFLDRNKAENYNEMLAPNEKETLDTYKKLKSDLKGHKTRKETLKRENPEKYKVLQKREVDIERKANPKNQSWDEPSSSNINSIEDDFIASMYPELNKAKNSADAIFKETEADEIGEKLVKEIIENDADNVVQKTMDDPDASEMSDDLITDLLEQLQKATC